MEILFISRVTTWSVFQNPVTFGVIIFNTVSFCRHFHAYEVAETSLHNIVNIEELEFPYTEILRPSESKHFVVIRYHITGTVV